MNRQIFTELLEMKEFKAVKSILEDMDTATIAELLGELKEKERGEAFSLIETSKKEKVFAQLNDDMQSCLEKSFTEKDRQNIQEVQEKQYFDTSVLIHAKNRMGWLLFLMLSATITQTIIAHYESAFAAVPLLVSFIPMLTDTGGNCGSQSSTLIIRGIALDEIGFRDIFKVMFKEVRVALLVSLGLAAVNGIYILLRYHNGMLAVLIAISLTATIFMAKLIGCVLPLFAGKFHLDPAIMAAPLITTIVDAGSIMIYFTIATKLLGVFEVEYEENYSNRR